MSTRNPVVRSGVALCLLLVQLQVFAAATLGCLHNPASSPGGVGCPYHLAATPQATHTDGGTLLHCQKCALHATVAGHQLASASMDVPVAIAATIVSPLPARHFFRHTPSSPLKPPISGQR